MPRYFFDLINGIGLVSDEEGAELADDETARAEAIRQIRPIIAEDVRGGCIDLTGRIIVRSDDEATVHEVGFDKAVRIVLPADRREDSG